MNNCGLEMSPAEKAAKFLAARSLRQLISDFEMSGIMYDCDPVKFKDMPTVRGWIMDELKHRDPVAYDDWIFHSGEDSELSLFFKA